MDRQDERYAAGSLRPDGDQTEGDCRPGNGSADKQHVTPAAPSNPSEFLLLSAFPERKAALDEPLSPLLSHLRRCSMSFI